MRFFKGFLKFAFGIALFVAGISVQAAWLAFCFGTIIVGILMLFFAPQWLFGPFAFLCIPGYRTMKTGLADMMPKLNPERAAARIATIVVPQIDLLEAEGLICPTDYKVLAYVMALSQAATKRPATIVDGMSVLKILFADKPRYKHSVANIYFTVVNDGEHRQLWPALDAFKHLARAEVEAGKGQSLTDYAVALAKSRTQVETDSDLFGAVVA